MRQNHIHCHRMSKFAQLPKFHWGVLEDFPVDKAEGKIPIRIHNIQ